MSQRVRNKQVKDFWLGVTSPSLLAVTVASVTTIVIFCVMAMMITPRFMGNAGNSLFSRASDDYDIFSTTAALRLNTGAVGAAKKLIILGGSTTRAALLESDIKEALRNTGNDNIDVIKLCTNRQMLWDSLTLIDAIPAGAEGVIILGLTPGVFTSGKKVFQKWSKTDRLGLRSDAREALWATVDLKSSRLPATGIYAFDNVRFLLGRWQLFLNNIKAGEGAHYIDSIHAGQAEMPRDKYLTHGKKVSDRLQSYEKNVDENLKLLSKLVQHVREKTRMSLVFLEAPINPQFVKDFKMETLLRKHEGRMREFTNTHDIQYIDVKHLADLNSNYFYDWAHLRDEQTVEAVSQQLVLQIGDLLINHGVKKEEVLN